MASDVVSRGLPRRQGASQPGAATRGCAPSGEERRERMIPRLKEMRTQWVESAERRRAVLDDDLIAARKLGARTSTLLARAEGR